MISMRDEYMHAVMFVRMSIIMICCVMCIHCHGDSTFTGYIYILIILVRYVTLRIQIVMNTDLK